MRNSMPERPDSEETRERILSVCRQLFASKGFDGTGIEEIARRAGIAKSLIYYHFRNKDHILETLLESYMDQAVEAKRQAVPAFMQDPARNLREAMSSALDAMDKDRDLIRIMIMEALKETRFEQVMPHIRRGIAAGFDFVRSAGKRDFDEKELTLKAFFFGFMPITTFLLFVDKWAAGLGADPKWARERFLDAFTDVYFQIMKEIFAVPTEEP